MKGFLVFALCVIAVSAQESQEWKESGKQCADKEGLDLSKMGEMFKAMKEGGEVDKNMKCFFACMMEAKKIMGADMTFNAAAAQEIVKKMVKGDEEKATKAMSVFNDCASQMQSSDRCDRAWEYTKCVMPKMKELGFGRKGSKE